MRSHTHRGITNLVRIQALGTVGQRAVAIGNVILAVVSRSLRIIHEQELLDLALNTHIYHSLWLGNIQMYWCNSSDQREIKPHLTLYNRRTCRCKSEKSFKMKNNLCNTDEIRVKLVECILFAYTLALHFGVYATGRIIFLHFKKYLLTVSWLSFHPLLLYQLTFLSSLHLFCSFIYF